MKKFLQKLSVKTEDCFSVFVEKSGALIAKHPEISALLLLAVACFIFLFLGLDFYPLMDVDETRYAIIARDLLNSFDLNSLMLNNVPFLEKPPLYFWLVALSIKLFGHFNQFVVRLPIALLSAFVVFFTYFFGKKVISRKFGLISALVLLSSIFFLILSHIAILDMLLTVFVTSALYCAFLTEVCEENSKKYLWWYFYTFVGLGVLSKGILALAIPVVVVFLYFLAVKKLKQIFKPIYLIPGLVILGITIIPWHVVMYTEYGYQFIRDYFLVHHFARFINSESIGRERPLLYFVPVFFLGFMPWSFIFVAFLFDSFKKIAAKFKAAQGKLSEKLIRLLEVNNSQEKLLLFCAIYFIIVFVLFSSSSTKLPTYILPLFPVASLLTGYYWWSSDEKGEHSEAISVATQIISAVFIVAAIAASIAYYFLPFNIQYKIESFKEITIITLYMLSILLLLRLKTKRAMSVFAGYIVTMVFVISLAVSHIFNFVYNTGENEIVKFSSVAFDGMQRTQLVTFDFAIKPSAKVEFDDYVNFITDENFAELDRLLQYRGGPTFVIVKNSNFDKYPNYRSKIEKRLKFVQSGERYSLYAKGYKNPCPQADFIPPYQEIEGASIK